LTKIYGADNTEVVAMRDASMTVIAGEVVALLGLSGSGKSTFLTAVGLIKPTTSGKIYIANQFIMDGSKALTNLLSFRRKHLGFVFQ
jgi:putative ABC transport system ATP-binding protein